MNILVQSASIAPRPTPSDDWSHWWSLDWSAFSAASWATFAADTIRPLRTIAQSVSVTPEAIQ